MKMQSKEGLAESFDAGGGGDTSDVLLQLQLSPDGQQPGVAAAAVFLNPLEVTVQVTTPAARHLQTLSVEGEDPEPCRGTKDHFLTAV